MASPHEFGLYREVLVFLGAAGVVIPVMARLKISPVLAFLTAGIALGPHGLGRLAQTVPLVEYVAIVSQDNVDRLGELGVVFLLFTIGLELSFDRLKTMRRLVFGFGMSQVLVTTVAIGAVGLAVGTELAPALVVGGCLALSSTAIVLQLLSEQGRLASATGRTVFAVLLAQDLAVVPMLFLVAVMSGTAAASAGPLAGIAGSSVLLGLALSLTQGAIAVGVILGLGHTVLRPLLRLVARTGSRELFMAATLFILIGSAVTTQLAGLSMALGAFLAGLLLSETEFRREIEVEVDAFKGLLLGLFFMSVGMRVDVAGAVRAPVLILLSIVGVIGLKAAIVIGLGRAFGVHRAVAVETGLLLAGGGEFAFLLLGLARGGGIVSQPVEAHMLLVAAATMLVSPALAHFGRLAGSRARHSAANEEGMAEIPADAAPRALVIGYGRVGRLVAAMLADAGQSYLAIDRDADLVAAERQARRQVVYGDATRRDFLKRCGLADAPAVIVTMDDPHAAEHVVAAIRAERAEVPVIVRARDGAHATRLFGLGATDVISETLEASLDLASAALRTLGGTDEAVEAAIEAKRTTLMAQLRAAASARAP